jgi:hypothetical protein
MIKKILRKVVFGTHQSLLSKQHSVP